MGQYYRIVIQDCGGNTTVNDRRWKGSEDSLWNAAKLTEFSFIGNIMTSAVAFEISKSAPCRVMFVGDYAEKDELLNLTDKRVSYTRVWKRNHKKPFTNNTQFDYSGKFLVNYDKRLYIDYDQYIANHRNRGFSNWTVDPLPILTAVGNGRGGGDYHGRNQRLVGSWAWDYIEIVDDRKLFEGFRQLKATFGSKR